LGLGFEMAGVVLEVGNSIEIPLNKQHFAVFLEW
jgi:hypothetical protein